MHTPHFTVYRKFCVCVCVCMHVHKCLSGQRMFLPPPHSLGCSCSVAKLCPTLCDPMDCSQPSSSILCYPLFLSSVPASGFLQLVGSSHQVAKVLELQFQHQSFQWIFRVYFLKDWLVWSPCCPRDSRESSPAPQSKSINSSALSLPYGPPLTFIHDYRKNHSFDYNAPLSAKWCLCFLTCCLGWS